jgi:hypothetical protein
MQQKSSNQALKLAIEARTKAIETTSQNKQK